MCVQPYAFISDSGSESNEGCPRCPRGGRGAKAQVYSELSAVACPSAPRPGSGGRGKLSRSALSEPPKEGHGFKVEQSRRTKLTDPCLPRRQRTRVVPRRRDLKLHAVEAPVLWTCSPSRPKQANGNVSCKGGDTGGGASDSVHVSTHEATFVFRPS